MDRVTWPRRLLEGKAKGKSGQEDRPKPMATRSLTWFVTPVAFPGGPIKDKVRSPCSGQRRKGLNRSKISISWSESAQLEVMRLERELRYLHRPALADTKLTNLTN
jgi:hypothetical protein